MDGAVFAGPHREPSLGADKTKCQNSTEHPDVTMKKEKKGKDWIGPGRSAILREH